MAEHCHLQELVALLGHILRMTTKCLRADSRLEWVADRTKDCSGHGERNTLHSTQASRSY